MLLSTLKLVKNLIKSFKVVISVLLIKDRPARARATRRKNLKTRNLSDC